VPLPVFPVPPVGSAAPAVEAVATVVDVVELEEPPLAPLEPLELLEPPEVVAPDADFVATASTWSATFKSAATMLGVGGADPTVSSSDWPSGPTTKRMYWANFAAFAAVSPDVGTTR